MCDPRVREWELVISPPGSTDREGERGRRERDGPMPRVGIGHTAAPLPPATSIFTWMVVVGVQGPLLEEELRHQMKFFAILDD